MQPDDFEEGDMKVRIEHDLCTGDGICEEVCPEVFEVREDGLAYVLDSEPAEDLWDTVREATEQCPTEAIIIEEDA